MGLPGTEEGCSGWALNCYLGLETGNSSGRAKCP